MWKNFSEIRCGLDARNVKSNSAQSSRGIDFHLTQNCRSGHGKIIKSLLKKYKKAPKKSRRWKADKKQGCLQEAARRVACNQCTTHRQQFLSYYCAISDRGSVSYSFKFNDNKIKLIHLFLFNDKNDPAFTRGWFGVQARSYMSWEKIVPVVKM
jgi:hypothetical protein